MPYLSFQKLLLSEMLLSKSVFGQLQNIYKIPSYGTGTPLIIFQTIVKKESKQFGAKEQCYFPATFVFLLSFY
jgi:hypothetical protein